MMKSGEAVSAALVVGALHAKLSGCQKQEGPAEQVGKEVDKAVKKAGQQIEKAGDSSLLSLRNPRTSASRQSRSRW